MKRHDKLPILRGAVARVRPFLRRRAPTPPEPGPAALAVPPVEPPAVPPLRPLRPRIEIAMRDPGPDATTSLTLFERGRHLARQDAWDVLAREMKEADLQRRLTPGLRPEAALLAAGARADALAAARTAIRRGERRQARAALAALEAVLDDESASPALCYVIATGYLEAALAWRGASRARDLAPQRREAYDAALRSARDIADRFDPFETGSALLAQLRCAVLEGDPAPTQRVCDDYEDLTDLDPGCPDHLTAFGRDLLPSRFGTFEILEKQARRAAQRTRDVWGLGGYAWVWIGAMEADNRAHVRADAPLFREALRDILDHCPDQHMVNRMAAFTGITLPHTDAQAGTHLSLASDFDWIAGERLTELHPVVWARAPTPGRDADRRTDIAGQVEDGQARALSTLAERFAADLGRAGRLVFGDSGLERPDASPGLAPRARLA